MGSIIRAARPFTSALYDTYARHLSEAAAQAQQVMHAPPIANPSKEASSLLAAISNPSALPQVSIDKFMGTTSQTEILGLLAELKQAGLVSFAAHGIDHASNVEEALDDALDWQGLKIVPTDACAEETEDWLKAVRGALERPISSICFEWTLIGPELPVAT